MNFSSQPLDNRPPEPDQPPMSTFDTYRLHFAAAGSCLAQHYRGLSFIYTEIGPMEVAG